MDDVSRTQRCGGPVRAVGIAGPLLAKCIAGRPSSRRDGLTEPRPGRCTTSGNGLGSKALVTFTLRNANDYAVKDIEIACAFARRDGSHLTDRRRVIADTVSMKSRKTYSGMLIGFVNVYANKAKCSPVTASRT
jgi:hypothetical protein